MRLRLKVVRRNGPRWTNNNKKIQPPHSRSKNDVLLGLIRCGSFIKTLKKKKCSKKNRTHQTFYLVEVDETCTS